MIQLSIGNSFSQITGLSASEFKQLKDELSYTIDSNAAYFSGSFRSTKRSLLSARGQFPSGLIYRVQDFYDKRNIKVTRVDSRKYPQSKPGTFTMTLPDGLSPRPEQAEVGHIAPKVGRGIIQAVTASGKSFMMALIMNQLQLRTLIIVPTVALKLQLQQTFKELFGTLENISVENIASSALKNAKDYGCLIIDEAHHSAAKTYRDLNKTAWKDIYYRFFFTATPFRTRSEEQLLMESITGRIVFKLSYQDAVNKGYIAPVEAYYVDVPIKEVDSNDWRMVYNQLVVNHKDRNDLIKDLIGSLKEHGKSTLCLVREIAHGTELSEATGVPFANGKDGLVRQRVLEFNLNEEPQMIGTVGVLGEGQDTRPCEWIILAGGGKSKIELMQNIGRGLRLYPGKDSCKVIFLRDRGHKFLTRHYKTHMASLLQEYGIKPAKLEVHKL